MMFLIQLELYCFLPLLPFFSSNSSSSLSLIALSHLLAVVLYLGKLPSKILPLSC